MHNTREQDSLGWWPAGVLAFFIALAALVGSVSWADPANLQQEIERQEADAAQIVNTLGRGKGVNQHTSDDTNKAVKVEMRKALPKGRSQG